MFSAGMDNEDLDVICKMKTLNQFNDIFQEAIKDCNKVLLSFNILFAIMIRAVDIYIFCQNEGTLSIARLICNMLM